MSKVITFSRTFPAYHPKAGQPTYFVEKFWNSIDEIITQKDINEFPLKMYSELGITHEGLGMNPKHHTIREGKRFKVGEKFSPRVWGSDINPKTGRSGAYQSKQIKIAVDIEIVKIYDFEFIPALWIDESTIKINGKKINAGTAEKLAMNDGLTVTDLINWFGNGLMVSSKLKPFVGQIICWNENIEY